jgi:hypothetical protein
MATADDFMADLWNSLDSLDQLKDVLVITADQRLRGSRQFVAAASPWLRSLLSATTDTNSQAGEASSVEDDTDFFYGVCSHF